MRVRNLRKKISINGLGWFIKRIKHEIKHPSHPLVKNIAYLIEYLRIFIRKLKKSFEIKKKQEYINFIYDLNGRPISFDFAYYLANAETHSKINGNGKFHVYFVKKNKDLNGESDYAKIINEESLKWRFNNIIIPLVNLYPACVGYSTITDVSLLTNNVERKKIFPTGYSSSFNPMMTYREIFKAINLNIFNGFRASPQGILYIKKWKNNNKIVKDIVCITLRQYGYDVNRNSNIDAWAQFADWIIKEGYVPVFIPDTDACWLEEPRLEKYLIFNEGCWNLELRQALYEISFVNYFYSNGCAVLATLNKNVKYILMLPIIKNSLHATQSDYESLGWDIEKKQLNFANKNQYVAFKEDTFLNIKNEFIKYINKIK